MLKLALSGCTGRMGQRLISEINENPEVELVGGLTRKGNPFVGQDIGSLIGETPFNIQITDKPAQAFASADVIIDFSHAEALKNNLETVLEQQKPYVVCFTGISEEQRENITNISKQLPIVLDPNMSLGVALLSKFAKIAAEVLGPSYDISILERHHRHKMDAPSGTSLSIANKLSQLGRLNHNKAPYPSLSPRPEGHIECAVLRGGAIGADHSVIFAGESDMFTLNHQTLNPSLFAKGAIKAAQWVVNKPSGLYSMEDVLGL